MIKRKTQDIFESDTNILIHQVNCQVVFGGGIARVIAVKYPEAYAADRKTKAGDKSKLGKFTFAKILPIRQSQPSLEYIFNVYGQYDMSYTKRATQYDALHDGLVLVRDYLMDNGMKKLKVGVPHKIGSGLGGGDWNIVQAILESVWGASPIELTIYKHPDFD